VLGGDDSTPSISRPSSIPTATPPADQPEAVLLGQGLTYPTTRTVDHVDTYHGSKVPDPYRWLEDDTSAETAKWVEAQNTVTFAYLNRIPYRAQLTKRLNALYNYAKYSAPSRRGER